jgi:hypothetical protein
MELTIAIVFTVIAAFFAGVALTAWSVSGLKEENKRLNDELHKLTDRDKLGRFTRKK